MVGLGKEQIDAALGARFTQRRHCSTAACIIAIQATGKSFKICRVMGTCERQDKVVSINAL